VEQICRGGLQLLPGACVNDFRIRVLYAAMDALRRHGGAGAKDAFGFQPEAGEKEKAAAAARAAAWWRSRPADLDVKARGRFDDPLFVARVHREIEILGQYKFLEMDRSRRALILLGSTAVPHLAAAIAADPAADPQGQTRIGAALALSGIGRAEGIPPVRRALARAELVPVRCQLLVALAILGPPDGVPEAAKLLDAPTDDERGAAVDALARCPTPGSLPALRRAAARKDLDPARRLLLATALLGVRDGSGGDLLAAACADADRTTRRRAWEGLDRYVDGLGPFDPDAGEGAAQVKSRWEAAKAAPRFRPRTRDGGPEGK
jgi:HEAT repeat protein